MNYYYRLTKNDSDGWEGEMVVIRRFLVRIVWYSGLQLPSVQHSQYFANAASELGGSLAGRLEDETAWRD